MKLFSVRSLIDEEPLGELPSEREAFKKAFKIAWPSVLESVLIQLVSIVDTVMVGTLGSYAIAAVALTVQPKFIGLCIFISLSVAVSALVARRKGEEKRNEANRTLGQALVIAILLTVVISAACIAFAEPIIRLGHRYPRIRGIVFPHNYGLYGVQRNLHCNQRGSARRGKYQNFNAYKSGFQPREFRA